MSVFKPRQRSQLITEAECCGNNVHGGIQSLGREGRPLRFDCRAFEELVSMEEVEDQEEYIIIRLPDPKPKVWDGVTRVQFKRAVDVQLAEDGRAEWFTGDVGFDGTAGSQSCKELDYGEEHGRGQIEELSSNVEGDALERLVGVEVVLKGRQRANYCMT